MRIFFVKIITLTKFSREIDLQFLLLFQITDPLEKALASKNKGNKYFKGGRYELAIKCYTEAIEVCPESKKTDLSTFYQNRAAAYEQLVSTLQGFLKIEIRKNSVNIMPNLYF